MSRENRALVLLVEDNPADVNLVREALSEAKVDCELRVVCNGASALELIEQIERDEAQCPDLILLDLNLPRLDGEEVLKQLRSGGKCDSVKVLVATSSSAPGDRQRAIEMGATDYFTKPSNLDQFLELGPKVRQMLGQPGS
jgi:CheY-like chemotaxis protein